MSKLCCKEADIAGSQGNTVRMSAATKKPVNVKTLARFVPIDSLNPQNLQELSEHAYMQEYKQGDVIVSGPERDHENLFLVEGSIELHHGREVNVIASDSDLARYTIAARKPRTLQCVARTDATLCIMDANMFDLMVTWDQNAGYEVHDVMEEEDSDWMTALLQIEIMQQLPAANIQSLFMNLERIPVKAGKQLIRQDDEGDYFYILLEGNCRVTRRSPRQEDDILLAELSAGDSFGEEALISNARRNASVTMTTQGVVMRLAKDKFLPLMHEPLQQLIQYKEAEQAIKAGAVWLDVRLPSEFMHEHYPGAVNMPLYFLRKDMHRLDADKQYVVYCDSGRRSASAAYLMSQRGYDVRILKGGMQSWAAGG